MSAVALLSPKPCNVLQNAHGRLSSVDNPVRSFVAHSDVSPSRHPNNDGEPLVSASLTVARNARNLREEVRKTLESALARHVPQYREPAKQVAANIQQSVGKVASIRRKIPEGMIDAALICMHYPEFAKAWAQVARMESDLHPDTQRLMSELVTLMQRRP